MNFRVLDRSLRLLADIDGFAELYYTRKFVEPGDFALSMPLEGTGADSIETGNFVLIGNNGTRLGIIESTEKKRLKEGTGWVVARGHEAKALLGRRIVPPPSDLERLELSGNAETVMKALVASQCGMQATSLERRLEGLHIAPDGQQGQDYALSSRLSNLLNELCRCAKTSGMGFSLSFDDTPGFTFDVLVGTDRSAGQTTNPRALISEGYDTMKSAEIKKGYSGLCNTLYVEGLKSPEGWPVVPAWQGEEPRGQLRFERALDAPLLQDEAALHNYGLSKLPSYSGEFFLEAEVLPEAPLMPDEDYSLGDICSVEAFGQWYTVPLESIEERWTKEGPGIRLGFGQPALGSHSTMMREAESLWEMLRSG